MVGGCYGYSGCIGKGYSDGTQNGYYHGIGNGYSGVIVVFMIINFFQRNRFSLVA